MTQSRLGEMKQTSQKTFDKAPGSLIQLVQYRIFSIKETLLELVINANIFPQKVIDDFQLSLNSDGTYGIESHDLAGIRAIKNILTILSKIQKFVPLLLEGLTSVTEADSSWKIWAHIGSLAYRSKNLFPDLIEAIDGLEASLIDLRGTPALQKQIQSLLTEILALNPMANSVSEDEKDEKKEGAEKALSEVVEDKTLSDKLQGYSEKLAKNLKIIRNLFKSSSNVVSESTNGASVKDNEQEESSSVSRILIAADNINDFIKNVFSNKKSKHYLKLLRAPLEINNLLRWIGEILIEIQNLTKNPSLLRNQALKIALSKTVKGMYPLLVTVSTLFDMSAIQLGFSDNKKKLEEIATLHEQACALVGVRLPEPYPYTSEMAKAKQITLRADFARIFSLEALMRLITSSINNAPIPTLSELIKIRNHFSNFKLVGLDGGSFKKKLNLIIFRQLGLTDLQRNIDVSAKKCRELMLKRDSGDQSLTEGELQLELNQLVILQNRKQEMLTTLDGLQGYGEIETYLAEKKISNTQVDISTLKKPAHKLIPMIQSRLGNLVVITEKVSQQLQLSETEGLDDSVELYRLLSSIEDLHKIPDQKIKELIDKLTLTEEKNPGKNNLITSFETLLKLRAELTNKITDFHLKKAGDISVLVKFKEKLSESELAITVDEKNVLVAILKIPMVDLEAKIEEFKNTSGFSSFLFTHPLVYFIDSSIKRIQSEVFSEEHSKELTTAVKVATDHIQQFLSPIAKDKPIVIEMLTPESVMSNLYKPKESPSHALFLALARIKVEKKRIHVFIEDKLKVASRVFLETSKDSNGSYLSHPMDPPFVSIIKSILNVANILQSLLETAYESSSSATAVIRALIDTHASVQQIKLYKEKLQLELQALYSNLKKIYAATSENMTFSLGQTGNSSLDSLIKLLMPTLKKVEKIVGALSLGNTDEIQVLLTSIKESLETEKSQAPLSSQREESKDVELKTYPSEPINSDVPAISTLKILMDNLEKKVIESDAPTRANLLKSINLLKVINKFLDDTKNIAAGITSPAWFQTMYTLLGQGGQLYSALKALKASYKSFSPSIKFQITAVLREQFSFFHPALIEFITKSTLLSLETGLSSSTESDKIKKVCAGIEEIFKQLGVDIQNPSTFLIITTLDEKIQKELKNIQAMDKFYKEFIEAKPLTLTHLLKVKHYLSNINTPQGNATFLLVNKLIEESAGLTRLKSEMARLEEKIMSTQQLTDELQAAYNAMQPNSTKYAHYTSSLMKNLEKNPKEKARILTDMQARLQAHKDKVGVYKATLSKTHDLFNEISDSLTHDSAESSKIEIGLISDADFEQMSSVIQLGISKSKWDIVRLSNAKIKQKIYRETEEIKHRVLEELVSEVGPPPTESHILSEENIFTITRFNRFDEIAESKQHILFLVLKLRGNPSLVLLDQIASKLIDSKETTLSDSEKKEGQASINEMQKIVLLLQEYPEDSVEREAILASHNESLNVLSASIEELCLKDITRSQEKIDKQLTAVACTPEKTSLGEYFNFHQYLSLLLPPESKTNSPYVERYRKVLENNPPHGKDELLNLLHEISKRALRSRNLWTRRKRQQEHALHEYFFKFTAYALNEHIPKSNSGYDMTQEEKPSLRFEDKYSPNQGATEKLLEGLGELKQLIKPPKRIVSSPEFASNEALPNRGLGWSMWEGIKRGAARLVEKIKGIFGRRETEPLAEAQIDPLTEQKSSVMPSLPAPAKGPKDRMASSPKPEKKPVISVPPSVSAPLSTTKASVFSRDTSKKGAVVEEKSKSSQSPDSKASDIAKARSRVGSPRF